MERELKQEGTRVTKYYFYETRECKRGGKTYHVNMDVVVNGFWKEDQPSLNERAAVKLTAALEKELAIWNEKNDVKFLANDFERVEFGFSDNIEVASHDFSLIRSLAWCKFLAEEIVYMPKLMPTLAKERYGEVKEYLLSHGLTMENIKKGYTRSMATLDSSRGKGCEKPFTGNYEPGLFYVVQEEGPYGSRMFVIDGTTGKKLKTEAKPFEEDVVADSAEEIGKPQ